MQLRYRTLGFNQSDVIATIEGLLTELDIAEPEILQPEVFSVSPAYPNPFNAAVTIPFALSRDEYVTVTVYDIAGNVAAVLSEGKMLSGEHRLKWTPVQKASGVYFIVLQTSQQTRMLKVFQLK